MRIRVAGAAALVVPLALWMALSGAPPAVAAPPTISIVVPAGEIVAGVPVTFGSTSADPDPGDVLAETWDFNGEGTGTGPGPTFTFATAGTKTVTVTATDVAGETGTDTVTVTVLPPNVAPTASFVVDPPPAITGRPVTFRSTSADPDPGSVLTETWDFNGEGTGTGPSPTFAFATAGTKNVTLTVTDNRGATAVATGQVIVADNQLPSAAFGFSPTTPAPGETVTFTSQASDPDGTLTAVGWDLDNDGAFDDGSGATASLAFRTAGSFTVAHQATDDSGASAVVFQTVPVSTPPSLRDGDGGTGFSSTGSTPPRAAQRSASGPTRGSVRSTARLMMSPFPIVRIRGQARGARVTLSLVSVRAPRGATVRTRCRGRGCPRKRAQKRSRSGARPVRMRALERRYAPGAVLEVYVSLRGRIGKYVRFRIRRGAAPARRDMCLPPRGTRPISCPGTSGTPAAATE